MLLASLETSGLAPVEEWVNSIPFENMSGKIFRSALQDLTFERDFRVPVGATPPAGAAVATSTRSPRARQPRGARQRSSRRSSRGSPARPDDDPDLDEHGGRTA
jgi:hypothetical protein